jgi:hypothetical protein
MARAARRLAASLLSLAALSSLPAGAAGAASPAAPALGRHQAELCVATKPKPLVCGPTQADLRSDGQLRLRVDDIVYTLQLRSSQVEVVVMHNVVQIDEFTVPYQWVGDTLQFADDDRNSQYEVRFPARKR